MKTAVIYWSGTGNTEAMARAVAEGMTAAGAEAVLLTPAEVASDDLNAYAAIAFGCPAMGSEVLEEMEFQPMFDACKRSLGGKRVALFGCGDQEDYAEYFCDALGTIRDIIEPRGATIVGHWPTAGYHFEASKGLADEDHFVGLAIDEDRQPELTNERVEKWVKQVAEELHLEEIKNA